MNLHYLTIQIGRNMKQISFAAELLLSDDCVLNALNEDQFFFQAAKALYVPAELLDFKFRVMKRKGYKLESPIVSHGNFLKTIE